MSLHQHPALHEPVERDDLFEKCVEAALMATGDHIGDDAAAIARAVLTTLLENTGSVRTKDELRRVLAQ